ncbi:MAG TPA: hypothetical protein VLK29_06505 [Luteimonas sp.]|nr:hypothetical protein [Luteimonas sp.]
MAVRAGPVLAVAIGALVLVAVIRGCGDGAGPPAHAPTTAGSTATGTASVDGKSTPTPAQAVLAATVQRRNAALQSAVDTLQRYLAALGATDKAAADAYWANGRVPARSGEADLRALQDLRAVRIENGTPVALDSEDVPTALEIPVQLRVSRKGAAPTRYAGWYRLRRAITGERWEITSASIDALPPQR